jgi:hypothetical protein
VRFRREDPYLIGISPTRTGYAERDVPASHDNAGDEAKNRSNRIASLLAMVGILLSQLSRISGTLGIVFLCLAVAIVAAAIAVFTRGLFRARRMSRGRAAA